MTQDQAKKIKNGTRLVDRENPDWGVGVVKDRDPRGLTIIWSHGPVESRPFRYFSTIEIAPKESK